MPTPQPIQFLLHQLATNEGDRERYNKLTLVKCRLINNRDLKFLTEDFKDEDWNFADYRFHGMGDARRKEILETCLRSYENKAVLAVLEIFKKTLFESYVLAKYENNNTGIKTLHDKMFELVPEYREFINNEK